MTTNFHFSIHDLFNGSVTLKIIPHTILELFKKNISSSFLTKFAKRCICLDFLLDRLKNKNIGRVLRNPDQISMNCCSMIFSSLTFTNMYWDVVENRSTNFQFSYYRSLSWVFELDVTISRSNLVIFEILFIFLRYGVRTLYTSIKIWKKLISDKKD